MKRIDVLSLLKALFPTNEKTKLYPVPYKQVYIWNGGIIVESRAQKKKILQFRLNKFLKAGEQK